MIEFSDEKFLLDEIKKGNNQAFEYLFKTYYPRLRGYAFLGEAGIAVGSIGHIFAFCDGA